MEDIRNGNEIPARRPEGKRPKGRIRLREEDNVKIDIQK
jgi:translation initiation factor IF-1